MTLRTIAAALLAFALSAGAAPRTGAGSQDQIVGSWNFRGRRGQGVRRQQDISVRRDAQGILIFTAEGRFAQIHVAGDVPKIASNNRPDRHTGRIRRDHAAQPVVFGTYTVDETKKTVTYNIVSASYPNWEGEAQTRTIDKLTADEFVNTNSAPRSALRRMRFSPPERLAHFPPEPLAFLQPARVPKRFTPRGLPCVLNGTCGPPSRRCIDSSPGSWRTAGLAWCAVISRLLISDTVVLGTHLTDTEVRVPRAPVLSQWG